jgi:hypothetical protein
VVAAEHIRRAGAVLRAKPEDAKPTVDTPHDCVHERNWRDAQENVKKYIDILGMLLELEPGLERYRTEQGDHWMDYPRWDVETMRAAIDHKRGREALAKFGDPIVKP